VAIERALAPEQEGRVISQIDQIVSRRGVFPSLVEALRLHQWAKNLLVFVPLILAGQAQNVEAWTGCLLGFLALGILASSTYLLNDVLDLQSDRSHWSKRGRALARSDLPVPVAAAAGATGVLISFAIAAAVNAAMQSSSWFMPPTAAYSLGLARRCSTSFCWRSCSPCAGLRIYLADVAASPWLLVFSMFLFTSLSLAKRQTEIRRSARSARSRSMAAGIWRATWLCVRPRPCSRGRRGADHGPVPDP
jgi:4-hydroxybenzoate polyprenyltransferase